MTEVARRWQVSPQLVFDWRRQARQALAEVAVPVALSFVPVVSTPPAAGPRASAAGARRALSIEVTLAGAVMRIAPGTEADLLEVVLRALWNSAT